MLDSGHNDKWACLVDPKEWNDHSCVIPSLKLLLSFIPSVTRGIVSFPCRLTRLRAQLLYFHFFPFSLSLFTNLYNLSFQVNHYLSYLF